MADISLNRKHSFGAGAKDHVHDLVTKFQSRSPELVTSVVWNDDKTGAIASGKMFKADFKVTDNELTVEVELIGMMAKMAKGMVKDKLEKIVGEKFPA